MKHLWLFRLVAAIFLVSVFCPSYLYISKARRVSPGAERNSLVTNENFIRSLSHAPEVDDRVSIFRYVFSSLGDEVMVYPTENYYYFECALRGMVIKGNIGLLADSRDKGIVNFSYEEDYALEDPNYQPLEKEVDLSAQDGVDLKKINDFKYTIGFEGKSVTFNLNDVGMSPPRKAVLSPDEIFVGPSFDESGLQFYLIYTQKCNALFWILNEDASVPEQFFSANSVLLIGRRTEFAFYDDKGNNRKILIGVKEGNVSRNDWYDGPFDQLPDNYIKTGQVEVQKYLESCQPSTKGKIDKYGVYLNHSDLRIGITPYFEYSSKDQLVKLTKSLKALSKSKCEFYGRLMKGR